MNTVIFFALGFAPGIFWLWYFYRKDMYEPEPQMLVLRTALFGILAAVPVVILEMPFDNAFVAAVLVAPVVEELAKFCAVRFTVYNNPEFNEPMDGITYAAAAALGFASIENVAYIANQYAEGGFGSAALTFGLRAVLSVPGHVLFSTLWGHALGRAKFSPGRENTLIVKGLALAMLGHAAFNFLLTIGLIYGVAVLVVPALWRAFRTNVDDALDMSPFKTRRTAGASIPFLDEKARAFFDADPHTVQTENEIHHDITSDSGQLERIQPQAETPGGFSSDDVVLPPAMQCAYCSNTLSLTLDERTHGWYACPQCGYFNMAHAPRVLPALMGDKGTPEPVMLMLKPFVMCPSCGAELAISIQERCAGVFMCPECQEKTEYSSVHDAVTAKQFLLGETVECPECNHTVDLREDARNNPTFFCPHCKSRIDYVEE